MLDHPVVISSLVETVPAVNLRKAVMVTNCTGRKRGTHLRIAMTSARLNVPTSVVAQRWVDDLRRRPFDVTGDVFYAGRGFNEVRRAAACAEAPVAVVSAGLGLVWAQAQIPAYDVTISEGSNSVADHLSDRGESSSDWWRELTLAWGDPSPFERLLRAHPVAVVLIALPGTYLQMVQPELEQLPTELLGRLRIFSSRSGRVGLSRHLSQVAMPYDDRLEGTELAGTRGDFPQRALRHFVETLSALQLDAVAARAAVAEAMAQSQVRHVPTRTRQSDNQIIEALNANWHAYNGESSRLLRYLRDEAMVACEQSRFKGLWHLVKSARRQGA